jgi:hypothetical protein
MKFWALIGIHHFHEFSRKKNLWDHTVVLLLLFLGPYDKKKHVRNMSMRLRRSFEINADGVHFLLFSFLNSMKTKQAQEYHNFFL